MAQPQAESSSSSAAGDLETQRVEKTSSIEAGATEIEAIQAIWGKTGRWLVIAGLAMIMITYELDNSTVYIYNNYSTSEFNALSTLASLSTASTIIFCIIKPPIAKISNVLGRGQTYFLTISFYILSYILMASARSIHTYAVGVVFYAIGQSGTNTMNDIVISDITTARWRGFAIGISFLPFLVTPWVAAFIVDAVVGGVGWRWGIGMFALLMPFGASLIITTLLYYQRRARSLDLAARKITTVREFCSQIDLGGVILLCGGLALLLLPLTLAAQTPSSSQGQQQQQRTPYLAALIALGATMLLLLLPLYEAKLAAHPILPLSYFRNRTIVLCLLLVAIDTVGFATTHTYLYPWVTISHNFPPRDATFFVYTNGVTQALAGIIAGAIMVWTGRYKRLAIAGATIRLVGYAAMVRLRGADNSTAELFTVQLVQGLGSGIVQTTMLVPAQISVVHAQMPQMTALVVSMATLGGAVGACVSGGIYTRAFKLALWRHLGDKGDAGLVDELFDSITGEVPAWGTAQRIAVNLAFSDVLRNMTYVALGTSAVALVLSLFIPNHKLPDRNNLVEA